MSLIVSLAMLLLVGCVTDVPLVPTRPDAPDPPTSTADTGEADGCASTTIDWMAQPGEEPLTAGSEVTMAHGPQGGWHIAVNAGIHGPNWVNLQAIVQDATTGQQLAGDENTFDLILWDWDEASCGGEMRGMLAYLDEPNGVDQSTICGLVGRELLLTLLADDGESAEVTVVAAADPNDSCP